jgi:hypothetical protein
MKQTPLYQAYAAVAQDPERNWPRLHDQMGRLLGADYDSAEVPKIKAPTLIVVGDWDAVRISHTASFSNCSAAASRTLSGIVQA